VIPKRAKRTALIAGAVMGASILPATALSTASAAAAPHAVYQETRGIDRTYHGQHSGDWAHCTYVTKANYTQYPNCSVGQTVTADISGDIGFTYDAISASVGFDVSFSTTVTAGNSVVVKAGGSGWFDVGFVYASYRVGMERRTCYTPGPCNPWSRPDWVTVQDHLGNTFYYFGTGAE
jgi:hypothetical protein